ncbi:MAG: iron ABC transporter permease [Candidatus Methanomethylophilaceae archaeon]|nr:iron ABC transporter permease [Candidatus Methanomethylophilaceae archaeon]
MSGEELTKLSPRVVHNVEEWISDTDSIQDVAIFDDYRKYVLRKWLFIVGCIIVAIIVTGIALTIGPYDIQFVQCYEILWNHITGNYEEGDLLDYIVVDLRMPRIVLGIIAGAGLAVCGVAMQSTLMNPLADPYTTGVSSGASFGATLAITMGATVGSLGNYGLIVNAFIFSLIPTLLIVSVAKMKNASPTVMIMAGIAVMYIFNALTTVMMLWANPNDMAEVYRWQVGSLTKGSWSHIPIVLAVVAAGIVVIQLLSRKLNVLSTGDDNANSMGVDASRLRTVNLVIVSLVAAAVVSFTGLIGFVGLVSPHMVRMVIGPDNRYLVIGSAAFGAAMLILADLVGRTIIAPAVLEVGVITAFLGGPVFLWLMMKKNSEIWG